MRTLRLKPDSHCLHPYPSTNLCLHCVCLPMYKEKRDTYLLCILHSGALCSPPDVSVLEKIARSPQYVSIYQANFSPPTYFYFPFSITAVLPLSDKKAQCLLTHLLSLYCLYHKYLPILLTNKPEHLPREKTLACIAINVKQYLIPFGFLYPRPSPSLPPFPPPPPRPKRFVPPPPPAPSPHSPPQTPHPKPDH